MGRAVSFVSPCVSLSAGGLDLRVDLLHRHRRVAGSLECGRDGEQPVQSGALFGPDAQKIHEVLDFCALLGWQCLQLLDQGGNGLGVYEMTPAELSLRSHEDNSSSEDPV
jgi:hypothetical protein